MTPRAHVLSRRELIASGAAIGLAACGGPARGRDPLDSIQEGLAVAPLPHPWKPIVVRGTAVEVAGHRYRFDAGPLPTSLEVNGTELLFDAMKLDIRVQDELLVWQRVRTISADAAEVELLARGNAGDLIAQARVTISYDGTCRFRVILIPQGVITIDSILLDVPILRTETTQYAHHVLGADTVTYSLEEIAGAPQAQWGGGRVPDIGWSGDITPFFWVGNPDRGIVWFTDSIIGPQREGAVAQVQLRPVAGAMRLLVELITGPLDMPDTVHLDFGLQPTPMRPTAAPQSPVRQVRVEWSAEGSRMAAEQLKRTPSDTQKTLESLRDRGATALVLQHGWSEISGFPILESSENKRAFRELVDLTHDAGLKIIPEISVLQLSNRVPGAKEILEDMPLPMGQIFTNTSPIERIHPLFHTDATVSLFEDAVRKFATEFPIDGVHVTMGEPAVRLLDRNEGVPGAVAALDLHARRDLLRRLYALFHGGLRERDEDGLVIAHSLVPWSMVHGFADLLVTGLFLFQSIASRRLGGEALAERWQPDLVPYLYGDVLHQVPTLWQVPAADTPIPSIVESYTREELVTDQELFGLAAVHNTSLWPEELTSSASFENLARLDELRLNLGFGDASWHPYWQRQQRLIVQPPSTFFGYWQKDSGSILLLLLNGANDEQEVLIELPSAGSGNVARLSVVEVWGGLPIRTRDNLIVTTLERSQFAVLHIQ